MGALGWATYIPSALISGSIYSVEQQADQMLNDTSYWRFQTRVPYKHSSIDDASPQNLLWLKRAGKELVRCEKERLDQLCDILTEGLN
ncbi:hypothetical protein DSO57_1009565 [Entomophthora muscae]|uniref:Uncharacterized protein n=2 Tax=Entomophthora muscae TaxID=34485 RepID=A0ACC2RY21_9FUNG|nr:hypothetical protein DSO57_1009565 [Entomophthora muscae]